MEKKITMVEETKIVRKEIYIANDGTEFETMGMCIDYEQSLLDKKINSIRHCDELGGFAPFSGEECSDSNTYRWFYPTSKDEIDLLNERYPENAIDYDNVGEWICIEESYDRDFSYSTTLTKCIRYAEKVLGKLGYKMTVEKVGEADV